MLPMDVQVSQRVLTAVSNIPQAGTFKYGGHTYQAGVMQGAVVHTDLNTGTVSVLPSDTPVEACNTKLVQV